jgi:hypothetical protein
MNHLSFRKRKTTILGVLAYLHSIILVLVFDFGFWILPGIKKFDYDFPDEIITTGVDMFYQISKENHTCILILLLS